jgi:hypothetical protein
LFLKTLESCTHSLIQSTNLSLMLVEDPKNKNVLDKFYISIHFIVVLYSKRCMKVKLMVFVTQFPKRHKKMITIVSFDECLFKGRRKIVFTIKHLDAISSINLFLYQIQCKAKNLIKVLLISKQQSKRKNILLLCM